MSTRLRVSIVCVMLAGCTPGADPSASEPDSQTTHAPAVVVERDAAQRRMELGPALGDSALVQPARLGRYAVAVSFTQHRYVTMEQTIQQTLQGSAVVELATTGELTACFTVRDSSVSATSHYQSRDGEDHRYETDQRDMLGARGRWAAVPGSDEIELRLDRLVDRSCAVADEVEVSPEPLTLRCLHLASTAKIPSASLLCRSTPSPIQRVVGMLSLMLGEQARSFGLRNDLALHEPSVSDEVPPWLLLGFGDGLRVRGNDDRSGIQLDIELADVPLPKPLD
jgi:hypothetical protein